jgi:hypothetical protein
MTVRVCCRSYSDMVRNKNADKHPSDIAGWELLRSKLTNRKERSFKDFQMENTEQNQTDLWKKQ